MTPCLCGTDCRRPFMPVWVHEGTVRGLASWLTWRWSQRGTRA